MLYDDVDYCCINLAVQVIFMQIPPLHPHIYSNGHICLGELNMFPLL